MQDIRVPVRVRRILGTKKTAAEPEMRYETSRFLVDLRYAAADKKFTGDIQRKAPGAWEATVEVKPETRNAKHITRKVRKSESANATRYALRATPKRFAFSFPWRNFRITVGFAMSVAAVALIIPGLGKIEQAQGLKSALVSKGLAALQNLADAGQSLAGTPPATPDLNGQGISGADAARVHFTSAYNNFVSAQEAVDSLGGATLTLLSAVPGLSNKFTTGTNLLNLGEHVSTMGKEFSEGLLAFNGLTFEQLFIASEPLTDRLHRVETHLTAAEQAALEAAGDLNRIDPSALPDNVAAEVTAIKSRVPTFRAAAADALGFFRFLMSALGDSNPRKYLILFQNNSEIRPTGGFIGSFGRLDFFKGRVERFYVNDVYNIDGQLQVNVIPPQPMQKITGGWSFHDANWFFDFPTSAKKLAWFYEKTGGPTVDGIFTLTPTVLEKILALTGPVALPDFNVTLSADNVVDALQYKVERDFDKTKNQPKTIVADLAARLMERFHALDARGWSELARLMLQALTEKDMLAWMADPAEEQFMTDQGWDGAVRDAPKDYLAVVNTNLNGYKTDRVIAQTIDHEAEVQPDGSVIDTVTLTRTHLGGREPYDWYNRVNSDYLRVYVPLGSQLLAMKGGVPERAKPPLDYAHLPFIIDPDVAAEENSLKKDPAIGTDVFEESGRTVLGNWVYVSPGYTATVQYRYKLPFSLDASRGDTYSLFVQKQPGAKPGRFRARFSAPEDWRTTWHTPDTLRERLNGWSYDTTLNEDTLYGVTVTK